MATRRQIAAARRNLRRARGARRRMGGGRRRGMRRGVARMRNSRGRFV